MQMSQNHKNLGFEVLTSDSLLTMFTVQHIGNLKSETFRLVMTSLHSPHRLMVKISTRWSKV